MQKSNVLNQLVTSGVIAVIRADQPKEAEKLVEAVVAGGITAIELTYSVPQAPQLIEALAFQYQDSDVMIGAGTVLDVISARIALLSGAQFIVSPAFNKEVAKCCNLYQVPYIPGIMTAKEAQEAMSYGSEVLKLFPGDVTSSKMIKDLKGPFPFINIMPSGGVTKDNISEWLAAGAVAVSAGGSITAPAKKGDYEAVTRNTQAFMSAYHQAKEKGNL